MKKIITIMSLIFAIIGCKITKKFAYVQKKVYLCTLIGINYKKIVKNN